MFSYTKNEKNKIFSLIFMILSNSFFVASFVLVFASDIFYYDYYNWLKIIDLCSCLFVVASIAICFILSSKGFVSSNSKTSNILWAILCVFQVLLLLVVFLNVISFYEGPTYILLLVGAGCFAISVLNLALFYGSSDANFEKLHLQNKSNQTILVYNSTKNHKVHKNLDKEKKKTNILNFKLFFGVLIGAFAYVSFFVYGFLSYLKANTEYQPQYMFLWMLLALFVIVLLCLCVFASNFKTTYQKFRFSLWAVISVVVLNFLLSLGLLVLVFFDVLSFMSIYAMLSTFFVLLISNYLIISDCLKLEYIYRGVL